MCLSFVYTASISVFFLLFFGIYFTLTPFRSATPSLTLKARRDKIVKGMVEEAISQANAASVSRAQRIQKWILLAEDFSLPGGELGKQNYYHQALLPMLQIWDISNVITYCDHRPYHEIEAR